MVENKEGFFHSNDGKTRESLIPNIKIGNLTNNDINQVLGSISNILKIPEECLMEQIAVTNVDVTNSIKIYDVRDNKIYGVLIFSKYHVFKGSPVLMFDDVARQFLNKEGINGYLFCIDKRLRGTHIDKKMLQYSVGYLKQFDYVWAGVGRQLKTHSYWKRMGFNEFLAIPEAIFYKMNVEDIIKRYS